MAPLPSGLPVNLDDLLHRRTIEGNRVELKAGWSETVREAVVRTVCAFANDLLNLGGGYVVIGVREEGGRPVLPADGLPGVDPERVQKEIRGACKAISPDYAPRIVVEEAEEGHPIVVVWAPGGDTRPYDGPGARGKERAYWVRQGPETVEARGEQRQRLFAMTAKVPFDDRRSLDAELDDISPTLVRRFLREVRSELAVQVAEERIDDRDLYRHLHLVTRVNAHEVPRNVALLFFNEEPGRFFRGARIDLASFQREGELIEERSFRGPLPEQVREVVRHLQQLGGVLIEKTSGQGEAEHTVPYPKGAVEEAVVNAIYHRGYDEPPEPTKVAVHADRLEVISYPGPAPRLEERHFRGEAPLPPVAARNRRIGELLKTLRLAEGWGTGIRKIRRWMEQNGSAPPEFDFDAERTYFRVTLPIHPRYRQLETT